MQSSSSSERAVSRNRVVSSRTIEPGETSVKTTRITSSKTENNEPVVRTRVITSQVSSSRGFESGDPVVQTRVVEMSEPTVRTRVITSEESSGEPVIRTTRVVTSKSESSSDPVVRTRVVTTRGESNPPPVVRTRVITSRGESGAGDTVVQTRVTSTHKEGEPVTRTTRVVELGEPGVTRTTTRVVGSGEPAHSIHTTRVVKKVNALNGGNKTFTETTVTSSKGASPEVRTVTRTSTKLVGSPFSKKSKISDIITGMEDETVTAREALLKWAQRTTERYPGIKITDFTKSWKDGLAFNAILHRNRPDLLDYRCLKAKNAKENLELAFSLAEKEFGITRLLDPEDVDTPEADEKSIITYISSIYDVFPEPSTYHPFVDDYEKNRKIEDYKELAKSFQLWMENSLKLFGDEKTSKTLIDMKSVLLESSKFRSEELPKHLREKQRLAHLFRDIQKASRHNSHLNIEKDLQTEELEKFWNKLTVALQERDQKIRDEICRLEKLQRLAEKINRDLKVCEGKLEDVNKRISEEEKRIRLHQVDIKHSFDQLEGELKSVDDLLKVLNNDILSLEEKGFKQISEIKTRFEASKSYYNRLKMNFESGLVLVERSEKFTSLEQKVTRNRNTPHEKTAERNDRQSISLKEHFDWIDKKHKRIDSIDFGNDYQTSKANLELLKVEQKSIELYKKKPEILSLASQKNIKDCGGPPESTDFEKLQSKFKVLLSSTLKKQQDMENFMDFLQSASRELKWMNDKEELEIGRDWSSKSLNIIELEKHQETLTSDLEKHEIQFNAVQSRGESLLLQKHPASKIVEGYLKNLQNKWSWLLQLTFCLEVHLRHAQQYQKFFRQTRESEQWMKNVEEKLNLTFNKAIFSIDEGEQYLKQMEKLKDEISKHSEIITSLLRQCNQVVPLKQRRTQTTKLLPVTTICNYNFSDGVISKDEKCLVKEIAPKMWKVQTGNGMETTVPSVCFVIPAPNPEAIEQANSLKKRYDDLLILWAQRQRKLRQNLILATIKVVKAWDISHFRKMDATQRDSIIRALNSDVQKLIVEGTEFSEPALVKLKEEMAQCNIAFETLTNQMSDNETEKSPKSAGRKLSDSMLGMQSTLNEKEKVLRNKLSAQVTWDLDSLENLVIEHKDFDNALRVLEDQIAEMIQSFKNTHKKTTALQMKHDALVQTWEKVSKLSHLYIEKLKLVDVALNQLSEVTQAVSNIEVKLASGENMSSDLKDLEKSHDNLLSFQEDMQYSQKNIDDAQESSRKLREVLKKIRSKQDNFPDLNKFDNDLKKLVARLENAKVQIIERLRSCGASSELLRSYKNKVEKDNIWISETTVKLNSLKTIKKMTTKEIELTVEPAMNMYSTIYERKSSFEDINTLGARYIREAKIYDLRLKHYKESLEEEHPSLDASFQKKSTCVPGADAIQTEIELLNEQYSALMQTVLDYLAELKESFTTQQNEKWCSTFSSAVPVSIKLSTSSTIHLPSKEQAVLDNQTPITFIKALSSDLNNTLNSVENTPVCEEKHTADGSLKDSFVNFKSSETSPSTDESAIENICVSRNIYNSVSGKMVTLYEAAEENIFNFETCEICDLKSGAKMSLHDATLKGFIDKEFCDRIKSKCGIYFPGTKEDLCIVDAVKQNLYDIRKGTLLNPHDRSPITLTDAFHIGIVKQPRIKALISSNVIKTRNLSLSEAIENKFLDRETGMFHEPLTGQALELKLAVSQGYINLVRHFEKHEGITLAEAIDRNFLQTQSGRIVDPDSGLKFTFNEAIQNGILNPDFLQIANVKQAELLDLNSALNLEILSNQSGKFINNKNSQQLTLLDARKRNFIWKPLSLKDIIELGLFNNNNIICPFTGKRMSLLEALSCGILDFQSRSILDTQSNEFLSLPDALLRGIVLPSCKYYDSKSNCVLTLPEAVEEGLIASVKTKMIFDIEGIKDEKANEIISLNTALERNIIDLNTDCFINSFSQESCKMDEAAAKGLIEPQIYDMLRKPIGINDGSKVLNLLECCKKGYIDSKTGFLKDGKSQKTIYLKEALNSGIITSEGAALLKGLLNITVTMASVTRKILHHSSSINQIKENSDPSMISKEAENISCDLNISEENMLASKGKTSPEICNTSTVRNAKKFNCNSDYNSFSMLVKSTVIPSHEYSSKVSNSEDPLSRSDYSFANYADMSAEQQNCNLNRTQRDANSLLVTDFEEVNNKQLPTIKMEQHNVISGTRESVQILELPPDGWDLKDAINKRLFNPETGLFIVPGTDRLMSFEETVKMEIINPKSAYVVVPYSQQHVTLDSALDVKVLDRIGCYCYGKTGDKLSMKKAITKNLITFSETNTCCEIKYLSLSPEMPTSLVPVKETKTNMFPIAQRIGIVCPADERHLVSEEFPLPILKNNQKVCSKPEATVAFWPQDNQTILRKIPKICLSPKDAATEGFIDPNTASILTQFFNTTSCVSKLCRIEGIDRDHSLLKEYFDNTECKIPDYKQGVHLSLKEALDNGILDTKAKKLLLPVALSLSVNEMVNQGLVDKVSSKIIHPESGIQLSIEEAIMCDILNPYSSIIDPVSKCTISITDSINQKIFNPETGDIVLASETISLFDANQRNLFKPLEFPFKCPPLLALTFPTALQYGYIDIDLQEYIHPFSKQRIPLQKAFSNCTLLSIPVQPQREYFLLDDAISKKLIDSANCSFKHPVTGIVSSVREAMQTGLLVIKPVRFSLSPLMLMQEHLPQNEFSSKIGRNVCIGNSTEEISKICKVTPLDTAGESLNEQSPNNSRTFDKANIRLSEPIDLQNRDHSDSYSILEVFNNLYDNHTGNFQLPNVLEKVSFEHLVKNNYINLDSLLYNTSEKCTATLKDAILQNIIDIETGNYIDKATGMKINIMDAIKLGYIEIENTPKPSIVPSSTKMENMLKSFSLDLEKTTAIRPNFLALENDARINMPSLESVCIRDSESKLQLLTEKDSLQTEQTVKNPSAQQYNFNSNKISSFSTEKEDLNDFHNKTKLLNDNQVSNIVNLINEVEFPSLTNVSTSSTLASNKEIMAENNILKQEQTHTLDIIKGENQHPVNQTNSNKTPIQQGSQECVNQPQNNAYSVPSSNLHSNIVDQSKVLGRISPITAENENWVNCSFFSDQTPTSMLSLSKGSLISVPQYDSELENNGSFDNTLVAEDCNTNIQIEKLLVDGCENITFSESNSSNIPKSIISTKKTPSLQKHLPADETSTMGNFEIVTNPSTTSVSKISTLSFNSTCCTDERSMLPVLASKDLHSNENTQLNLNKDIISSPEKTIASSSETEQIFSLKDIQIPLHETPLLNKENKKLTNVGSLPSQVSPPRKMEKINAEGDDCHTDKIVSNLHPVKCDCIKCFQETKSTSLKDSELISKIALPDKEGLAKLVKALPILSPLENKPLNYRMEAKVKEKEINDPGKGKLSEVKTLATKIQSFESVVDSTNKSAYFSSQNPTENYDPPKGFKTSLGLNVGFCTYIGTDNILDAHSQTSLDESNILLDTNINSDNTELQASSNKTDIETEKVNYDFPDNKSKLPLANSISTTDTLDDNMVIKSSMFSNEAPNSPISKNSVSEVMQEPPGKNFQNKLSYKKSISEKSALRTRNMYVSNTIIKTENIKSFNANQVLTEQDSPEKLVGTAKKEKLICKQRTSKITKSLESEGVLSENATPSRQSVPLNESLRSPVEEIYSLQKAAEVLNITNIISSDNPQNVSDGNFFIKGDSSSALSFIATESDLLFQNANPIPFDSSRDIRAMSDFKVQSKVTSLEISESFKQQGEIVRNVDSNNENISTVQDAVKRTLNLSEENRSKKTFQQDSSTLIEVSNGSFHMDNNTFQTLKKSGVAEFASSLSDFHVQDNIENIHKTVHHRTLDSIATESTSTTSNIPHLKQSFDENVTGPQILIPKVSFLKGEFTEHPQTNTSKKLEPLAVEENYKVCEDNTTQLELWLSDIENKLADLGVVQENLPGLQLQINTAQILKKELEGKQNLITTCLDQMRNLAQRGLEVLNKEEIDYLQKKLISLRRHYDLLLNESDRLLKRLITTFEELRKFKSEVQSFKQWIKEAKQDLKTVVSYFDHLSILESKSEHIRSFTNDVIAHQADLRFLTMAGQKFIDESQDYLKALNAFRTNSTIKLPALKARDSEIKSEVQEVTTLFHNFLNEVNKLTDSYATICNKYHSYSEVLDKARSWISEIRKSATKVISEPVADEPFAIQEQLDKLKLINMEVVGQSRIVENVTQAVKILVDTLDNYKVAVVEMKNIENNQNVVVKDYSELINRIGNRIKELQISLIQSQDIKTAVDRILKWLEETESTVKIHEKPVSLLIDKLEAEVLEYKILKSDVENQKQSIGLLESTSKEISSDSNPKLARKVDSKFKDVSERYDKIAERISIRWKHLQEVSENVHTFQERISKFEEWSTGAFQRLESLENVHPNDVDGFSSIIDYVFSDRNSKKEDFDRILQIGKDLSVKKDVCDIKVIKDYIHRLEQQWKHLDETLNEKKQLGKARFEQIHMYDALRANVHDCLLKIELELEKLEPVAVDHHCLKIQTAEIMNYLKEHSEYSSTIKKLNSIGNACDTVLRDGSKVKSSSPIRKLASPTRKSPSVQVSCQSPLSTVSSGFSSRQSSVDNIGVLAGDISPIQQQLSEINDRFNLLGKKISDRSQEITETAEGIKSLHSTLKCLLTYIDEKHTCNKLPKECISLSKGVIDKHLKNLQDIEKEMMEKQPEVYNLKMNALNILSKRKEAKGTTDLQKEFNNFEEKWTSLLTSTKQNILFLQDIKEFQELQILMTNWLNQKEKMFLVLGPIASEPRMVSSQVLQVQVMRDEFTTQKSFMERLILLSTSIIDFSKKSSPSDGKIEKQIESIQHKWNDMYGKLVEREKNLETASGVAKDFHKNLTELQGKIQEMSDKFETLEEKGYNTETFREKLMEMEDELDNLRPLLSDACSVSEQLCDVLCDSSSKSEIKYKISILEKSYATLRKKIDNKKAEVESSLKEDKVFFKCCEDIELWLNTTQALFTKSEPMSSNPVLLLKKMEEYERLYTEIMNKEHEIYLCLSKGADMLMKLPGKQQSAMKNKMESIKKQYETIKKNAIARHTSLRSCLENGKKYQTALDTFVSWLGNAEEKCIAIKPLILKREVVNKSLKEVEVLRSEVLSVHYPEFQNIQQLGEMIISNCELDRENTKKELGTLKKKWKNLNNDISIKIQSLEELSQVLLEFEEMFRDVKHKVERLEDKMCSHEALGNVPCDAMFLDRLKVLLEEINNMKSEINKLKKQSKLLIEKAGPETDTSEISTNIKDIESRHLSLAKKVEDRYTSFTASYKVVSVFMEEVRSLRSELSNFDESFHQMQPIARDLKTLKEQLRDTKELKLNLLKTKKKYSPDRMTESITHEDYISETKNYVEQVNSLTRQISRLEEHIVERETIIETMTTRIENFYNIYSETEKKVKSLTKKVDTCEALVGDVDTIRSKQKNFKEFHSSEVIPLSKHIVEVNKMGYGLVQSATNKVDTSDLEEKIEALNCNWNNLQEMINEKEKKLDIALLQSGKLQEALSGVERWLMDTEEMVSNQKPPSFEFKVCKAQVQEQKFLKKMLLDRQNSVMSLKTMETELISKTKTIETEQTETLLKSITSRFGGLISTAENRMLVLEKTIPIAQEYESISAPLSEWIETVEKRLVTMSSIPIEESQIKKVISEHKQISKDIAFHQQTVDQLNTISQNLKTITVDTDSETLHHKISGFNEKFEDIKASSENVGTLLKEAETGIGSFSASYKNSVSFIEETTRQLTHFDSLSVHFEKLQNQHKNLQILKENMNQETTNIEKVIASGENIMKFASGEDSILMKEKMDTLKAKTTEVSRKLNERLVTAETSLSLVESFYSTLSRLTAELDSSENILKTIDKDCLDVQRKTIKKLEESISEFRCMLDVVNQNGSRLCQMSTGEGSLVIENQMTRVNQRFENISEQVQRKDERIQLILQRKYDIVSDMEELSDWFEEVGRKVSEAEELSSEPNSLNMLLKEQKSVCEELNVQKTRVRDVITTAKKLMRESSSEDLTLIHEKIEDLKTRSNNVSTICQEKLSILEQALPLSQHFYDTHSDLGQWLDEVENQVELLEAPALNSAKIKKQQDRNKDLTESVQEHKPLVDKLNKTGSALTKLCHDDHKVEVILESDNSRYNALRKILREHQDALEEALQATSQFSDKLEGILNALTSTADQLHNAEPISAHPERIQEQINDNQAVLKDLDKRTITLEAVKKAAGEVITKASSIDEPAVKDIQTKLNRLNDLYTTIEKAAHNRGKSLEEALVAAERFWHELTAVMKALKELQVNLKCQGPPAVEPAAVQQQQEVLQEIKQEITQTKPEVDHCRKAGKNLMQLCGESDKPDVQKHIEDLDSVWENVTTLYAKREQNLVDAMEKAMVFHETLQNLLEFLDTFEEKFSALGAVSTDIDSVKKQISQLRNFKMEVDPHMIEVEALNRQAQELLKSTSSDQATSIREPLIDINKRWNELLKSIVQRQREMENALLKLGQFQHALEEQLVWISKTEKTLDDLKPILGDPQVIEIVLAKHKVISNDIHAHQSSIDMINRAGHEFLDSDQGGEDAKSTQHKLQNLLTKWKLLQTKSSDRYQELEEALKEAQKFHQEIQDLLMWLNELDGHLVTSKPVGGLPETAEEQLNKFMDLYSELDMNRYKVEDVLQQGQIYQKKAGEHTTKALEHNLRNLKQKWDAILNKASDRKIKLEIALREATEFNETLQQFVEWLTKSEKFIVGIKPVSRIMKTVLEQIEEHRSFQKEVGANRELMLNLDKKGTHLKYFSQKQDVILIKNLLQSVQHRWERIVSKAADRTRSLDHGYKESKEFHDAYASFSAWLDETEKVLDTETPIGNDPIKIKRLLSKHKEFQRSLGSKQVTFDAVTKTGRTLKDRCPKQDIPLLTQMLDELSMRWNKICVRSVNRQRQLEEALLHSGQFKDAVLNLMEWIDISIKKLSDSKPYHGDLDTVNRLLDEQKAFEEELKNRGNSLESVRKTAIDLKKQASETDVESINLQIKELNTKWDKVCDLSETRRKLLLQALEQAEKLYKMVHVLLEWLADAEVKLRFFGSLPEDDESTKQEIAEHTKFLVEMEEKKSLKNNTIELAEIILQKCHPDGITVIRHWITIIKARWDEISTWAKQCGQRLHNHLQSLKDISDLLEKLLLWLLDSESTLLAQEKEALPDDITVLDNLIKEHQVFMSNMSKKQTDVDNVSKAFSKHQKNKGVVKDKDKVKDKFPRSGPTGPQKTSTPSRAEIDKYIKHPRAKLLLEKWWTVWILAMERQRRLQDRRQYLMEVDKIKHFDFDDWRTRYLGWLSNKKSRIMDQFKKIDKNNVGKVTKQEFIDGILKSKFVTSRLEMEKVADIFDKNGDGFIDSKEYIEVLRPERESKPKTEDEKIQDEVQRQVAKCTCVHRFKVYQVGEGKYRFGESQKLRLVRILRSTVMVRVGGGWVALDEFLVKNDPCRAKGRTNLELREQFILADGVSQSMTPFKSKASPNSSVPFQSGSTNSIPSAGPITKIREKSERSTPMRQSRSSAENSSDISDLSYSETDSFSNRSGLLRTPTSSRHGLKNVNCKSSSRPSSRQGSRPASRAPSDLSQDGVEEFKNKRKHMTPENNKNAKTLDAFSSGKSNKTQPETSKIPSAKKTLQQSKDIETPK